MGPGSSPWSSRCRTWSPHWLRLTAGSLRCSSSRTAWCVSMGLRLVSATDTAFGRPLGPAQTYQAAGRFEQALVEVGASFVADAEPLGLGVSIRSREIHRAADGSGPSRESTGQENMSNAESTFEGVLSAPELLRKEARAACCHLDSFCLPVRCRGVRVRGHGPGRVATDLPGRSMTSERGWLHCGDRGRRGAGGQGCGEHADRSDGLGRVTARCHQHPCSRCLSPAGGPGDGVGGCPGRVR
ncbi:hypothetical protein SAMN05428939_0144 [Streptomyces sp. TLI_105]|nr:hypothetical protein SAMN05428939_0144 [Streptomyces sp. TLI_105]